MKRPLRFDTRAIHAGSHRPRWYGAVAAPIFQSATYESGGEGGYHDVRYMRLSNSPGHLALHARLASLEGAEAALVTASGMAAITGCLLTLLGQGDHLLVQDCLYGGTHSFVTHDLPRLGIAHDVIDGRDPGSWKARLRPETKVIYVETLANPLLGVGELDAVVRFAREHGLASIVDNTFATPFNYRTGEAGFDLAVHSATKYLNGHTDLIAGVVVGRGEPVERVKRQVDHLGGSLDALGCFLLERGLKTLPLRMQRHNESARAVAAWLAELPAVERVHHPTLPSHPDHERAGRLLRGCGGMLSFELAGGAEAADRWMEKLSLAIVAPSLGGVETLVTLPARTSHANLSAEERREIGIADGLVRVSVGLEAVDDLLEDFGAAF